MRLTKKVISGKPKVDGYFLYAPLGTALPTSETAVTTGFIEPGFVSSDGIKPTMGFSETQIRDWYGDVILTVEEDFDYSFEVTLVSELEAELNKFVFGEENVTVTAATATDGEKIAVVETAYSIPECAVIRDLQTGKKRMRLVNGHVKPMVTGIVEYSKSNALGYTLKYTVMPDDNGKYGYKYGNDGVAA